MTEETRTMLTGLYWQGKKTEVDRIVLPFQTIETINESRATREQEKLKGPDSLCVALPPSSQENLRSTT